MSDVALTASFQEKMAQTIREGIGNFLTDEDLKKLIDRGVKEVFFTEKIIPKRDYYGKDEIKPPLMHEIVKEVLTERLNTLMDEYLTQWIATNEELIKGFIKETFEANAGTAFIRAFDRLFQSSLAATSSHMYGVISNAVNNHEQMKNSPGVAPGVPFFINPT